MVVIAQLLSSEQAQTLAPKTEKALDALIAKRDELNSQLASLTDQRGELAQQVERLGSDPAVRSAPLARLKALDERIVQTEREVGNANVLIGVAKEHGVTSEGPVNVPPGGFSYFPNVPPVPPSFWTGEAPTWREKLLKDLPTTAPITIGSVLLLGAVTYWWISRSVRGQLNKLLALQSARLEELQRSVDTVAVEMERVSENQRYVTKLVGDKSPEKVERR